jgi:rhodanese-related sulfurtransferase
MNFKMLKACAWASLVIFVLMADTKAGVRSASDVETVTAEELKTKLTRNEPVTIIDVRTAGAYIGSDTKIKGAIRVKLRRLKSRLAFPPLRDVPRDREVVTYCACPNEETSIRAAQILLEAGFKRARALKGGWDAWQKAGGPVETRPKQ